MIEAAIAAFLLATPVSEMTVRANMGPGDLPMGTFCRIQDVCVIAQTEADCGKISGKTFATLEACQSPTSAAVPQQDR
ncbi:MAG: hypothetical protein FJX44_01595 [Alphaproteobacteria bacterium]|nr:hypothetical protein [Alphaproteobacteria bacterium]